MFEVVIFTASQSIYAEQLLDILDPEGNIISRRVYRESCIFSDGSYTKDLTVLGLDLAKVAIVDNSPQVHLITPVLFPTLAYYFSEAYWVSVTLVINGVFPRLGQNYLIT